MSTDKPRKVSMSTDKSEKTDREVSLTRRAVIKAGWAVPVILSIGLPVGDVFVHASTGWGNSGIHANQQGKDKRSKNSNSGKDW